mgnify:CR=1 FL=1
MICSPLCSIIISVLFMHPFIFCFFIKFYSIKHQRSNLSDAKKQTWFIGKYISSDFSMNSYMYQVVFFHEGTAFLFPFFSNKTYSLLNQRTLPKWNPSIFMKSSRIGESAAADALNIELTTNGSSRLS